MDDLEIKALVARLSRPHSPAVIAWILAHSGTPETAANTSRGQGLHGSRITDGDVAATRKPTSFVLPAGTVN
jgi:hypothetical protein